MSVVLDNVLLALILILFGLGGRIPEKLRAIGGNPVAVAALLLIGLLALALGYGERGPGDGLRYLARYVDILFIPVFIWIFRDPLTRRKGLLCFCIAMIATFVVAHLNAMGMLTQNPVLTRYPQYPGAFKESITHGMLTTFAAFVFALLAREARSWPGRFLYIVLALVAVENVVFIAISRTAYLVLLVLAGYFLVVSVGRRRFLMACVPAVVLLAGAYWMSSTLQLRVADAVAETAEWNPGEASSTSVGVRLEFYRTGLEIVREHPLLGSGTGSFPRAYARAVEGTARATSTNPHNEYVLLAVQTGIVGLVLMLHLFWRQWRLAPHLPTPLERDLARGLVLTFAIGCLFNSFLLDHTEGLLFAWFTGLLCAGLQSKSTHHRSQ